MSNTRAILEKLRSRNILLKDIHKRFLHSDHSDKINSLTPLRYVNWLFTVDKS